eukprot:gnl/TRDRNA2_/TRDRNA2_189371_c0_seq1.p1 gnl/TRDRNA2_/TRDRNA2_189371_c0~~gnl/TRDRNA2_/TRDRNA2_189371_c0_seq1.p1  ORF type:complete len:145 (-),score=39.75 gnl/TRDRNA2_/TRDRNA2_189371_c0_seq1:48-482(-)
MACYHLFITLGLAALAHSASLTHSDVVSAEDVYLVEFYHPMCGTCTEFSPIYESLTKKMASTMKVDKVSIGDSAGEQFAQDCGAIDEGIPHVKLFHKKGDKEGATIMVNELPLPSADTMKGRIEKLLGGKKDKYMKTTGKGSDL